MFLNAPKSGHSLYAFLPAAALPDFVTTYQMKPNVCYAAAWLCSDMLYSITK